MYLNNPSPMSISIAGNPGAFDGVYSIISPMIVGDNTVSPFVNDPRWVFDGWTVNTITVKDTGTPQDLYFEGAGHWK